MSELVPTMLIWFPRSTKAEALKIIVFTDGARTRGPKRIARVEPTGLVIGLDMDAQFLEHARRNAPRNVEFRVGDAYRSDLPTRSFDLVHMRFVASTAGHPEQLLEEATRLVRPGGVVALQEPDGSTLKCYPPHRAWDRLQSV